MDSCTVRDLAFSMQRTLRFLRSSNNALITGNPKHPVIKFLKDEERLGIATYALGQGKTGGKLSGINPSASAAPVAYGENVQIGFKARVEGDDNAHDYPLTLLPRDISERVPGHVYVYASGISKKHRIDTTLSEITRNKVSVVLLFDPSALNDAATVEFSRIWIEELCSRFGAKVHNRNPNEVPSYFQAEKTNKTYHFIPDSKTMDEVQFVKIALPTGGLIQHMMETIAGGMHRTSIFLGVDFQMNFLRKNDIARKQLFIDDSKQRMTTLLIDQNGYIRWHCRGKPATEAVSILENCIRRIRPKNSEEKVSRVPQIHL